MSFVLRLCFCLTFFASGAWAHAVAVNVDAFFENQELVAIMNGVQGEPINGASLAYSLLSESGEVSSGVFKAVADGEYRVDVPILPSGLHTLKLRDTTFPQEALEVAKAVQLPLATPVRFVLPPSRVGQPDTTLLVVLAILPVLIALIALFLVLFIRPKNKEVQL